jgi:hypothetical protein
MTKPVSALYLKRHQNVKDSISKSVQKGIDTSYGHIRVFFRADDIGIPSGNFQGLISCFRKHKMPLCLATVPSWLTENRRDELYSLTGKNKSQWCWHQHGVTHRNFESTGKKQEFGPSRSAHQLQHSLESGKARLTDLLGKEFLPVFTPPWNRCTADTLETLINLEFLAISRYQGAKPESPTTLPDLSVNVDLHTRKESTAELALDNLLHELERGISSGFCGIMLHHQRMNKRAFDFLDLLLYQINIEKRLNPVHFQDLLS